MTDLSGHEVIEVVRTFYPAIERFREIDFAYTKQGLEIPMAHEFAWQKLKRITQYTVEDQRHWK